MMDHSKDHTKRDIFHNVLCSPPEKGTQSQEGFQHLLPASSTCPQEETPWPGGPQGTIVDHLEEDCLLVEPLSKLLLHSPFLLPCQLRLVLPPVRKMFSCSFLVTIELLPKGGRQATACQKKQSAANASFAPPVKI